ncbi:MAG: hypothetical protein IJZ61_02345 [Oscillospiraceae bacterium]|nr:hypothetical protein [Oscillospiraceae bacterium]
MPDAFADVSDRNKTHFKQQIAEKNQGYFDFDKFKEQYFDLMQKDDLYLGYYMHLVEDAFYRDYIYCGRFRMPRNMEEVGILHNDYHILNSYISEKYQLRNILETPVNFTDETICDIADFSIDEFLNDMSHDFTENTVGETVFITENMLDEFIDNYLATGIKELTAVKNRTTFLKAIDLAYTRSKN